MSDPDYLNLRAKAIFDKRALVVEHLAMIWNCIVEKPWDSPVEGGLEAHEHDHENDSDD